MYETANGLPTKLWVHENILLNLPEKHFVLFRAVEKEKTAKVSVVADFFFVILRIQQFFFINQVLKLELGFSSS